MILVDSSVWVDADRRPASKEARELDTLLSQYEVAATDIVIAEVLQGAPTEEKFNELSEKMDALQFFHAGAETWLKAARLSFRLRRSGLATPLADLVIAQVALDNDLPVYATDEHFGRVEGLKLHAAS